MSITIPPDPLTLVYNGIVSAILADDFVKSLHDEHIIFLDFLPLPDMPNTVNPPVPAKGTPRVSLMQDTILWGPNNSCTGRIDYNVNIKVVGFGTRSVEFNPLAFHLVKVVRFGQLDGIFRGMQFEGKPLQTISKGGGASFEHDDERQFWTLTIPIEIQIFLK
jgi:hypothetical protein